MSLRISEDIRPFRIQYETWKVCFILHICETHFDCTTTHKLTPYTLLHSNKKEGWGKMENMETLKHFKRFYSYGT